MRLLTFPLVLLGLLAACESDQGQQGNASGSSGQTSAGSSGAGGSSGTGGASGMSGASGTGGAGAGGASAGGSGAGGTAGVGGAGNGGTAGGPSGAGGGGSGGAAGEAGSSGSGGVAGGGGTGGVAGCVPSLPTFADGKKPSKTIHVKGGAAPGGDGSPEKPFAGLNEAKAAITPGTEVRISGQVTQGAYLSQLSGTPEAPIFFRGEPGAQLGTLTFDTGGYIVVEDLELIGTGSGHVLHFFFTDFMLFRRLTIHNAGLGSIKGSQSRNVYVEEVDAYDAGKASVHPVIDFVGVNTGHVVRSKFHQGPGVVVMLKGGTSDLFFAWNDIYDQTGVGNVVTLGQSTGPQFFWPKDSPFEGLRIVAFANRIHDVDGAPFAFEGCKDCAFVHNVAWNVKGNQLLRFLPGAAGEASGKTTSVPEGCRFTGNIVVGGQPNGASLNADAQNTGPGNLIDHNIFLKPGALNWWGVIPQDTQTSTYDQDPELDAQGKPTNLPLVQGKGATDLDSLPFSSLFVRDFGGQCMPSPRDLGAFSTP